MCDMYVESCNILVVYWLNQDPSWYWTDYRVYMGLSMTVRLLADCHCTHALINWLVLRHKRCRVHKPRVPHGLTSQQRLGLANNAQTPRLAQIPNQKVRRAIQTLTGRPR